MLLNFEASALLVEVVVMTVVSVILLTHTNIR